MQTTTAQFDANSNKQVRQLTWDFKAAFERTFDPTITFFTLDTSTLDGTDLLAPTGNNVILDWDQYQYTDFSDRVISMEWQRQENIPYSTALAVADITLNNYDGLYNTKPTLPDVIRTNLITNPSIETNTSGFTTSGNELAFDGTGDYVSMTYTLPATGTISVIVNILEFKNYNTLWDCSADANKWECWINAAGALNMRTGSSTVIGNAAYTGGKGKWATITMTWTSGGNATAYLNGVAFGTVVATTDASSGTTFYWGGGNAGNTQGNFNMRRGTIWNVALSGDEVLAMYNNSTYPQQGNVTVDHLFDEGIGTSVADSSGNGVTGTITGTATWKIDNQLNTRSTEANNGSYSLKVNNPIMRNLDAELYPTVNVPTTTTARWADGTAAGSTTNDTYGWYNGSVGGFAFGFDTTTYYSGTASLKLSTTAVSSYIQARQSNNGYLGTRNYSTILEPSTSYTFTVRMKTNYVSGDSSHGATLVLLLHDSSGTNITSQSISTVKTTTDWTLYTKTFTTGSTTVMGHFEARIYGHTGAGTLIMDAWFDDITFSKTETLINKGIQYTISGLTNGETYSLSAYIKQLSAGDRIGLLAPTKNFISKVSTTEWQRLAFQFTASASTQKFYIQNYTTGNDFYIDNLLCETGTLQDYFDGNSIYVGDIYNKTIYTWNGTTNLSTSVQTISNINRILPNIPFKIQSGFKNLNIPQFVGLTEKMPTVDQANRTVTFHCVDFLTTIFSLEFSASVIYLNKRTDEILAGIFTDIGLTASQYSLDIGINNIDFAYFAANDNIGDAIKKLMQAELGSLYLTELGIIKFINRNTHLATSVYSFDKSNTISIESSNEDSVWNIIKINSNVREVQTGVVYTLSVNADDPVVLTSGTSSHFFTFENPVVSIDAITNYSANEQADGSGADRTISTYITDTDLFVDTIKITFDNILGIDVYLTSLVINGQAAKLVNKLEYQLSDAVSIAKYGEYPIEINNDFVQTNSSAVSIAYTLLEFFSDFGNIIEIKVKGTPALQVGDGVTVNIDSYSDIYVIEKLTNKIINGGYEQHIKAKKYTVHTFFILNQSILDGTDQLSP